MITGAGLMLSIMAFGSRYSFGIFLKSMEADFGVSRAAMSSIFSIYMLLSCFISVLGGWALDRYGPKKVGLSMGTITGLSLLSTSLTGNVWQLYISYSLLLALGTGATYTLVNTTTLRWFVKKRGFVVGITSSGGGIGAIAMAPFATYLISHFDWRTAFIVIGLLSWILMVAASLLLKKDPKDMGLLPDGGILPSPTIVHQKEKTTGQSGGLSIKQAFRMSQFWIIAAVWVLLSTSLHMIFVHFVPYAVDMGISAMDAALILSIIGFTNIVGRLIVGKLSDTIDRKRLGMACAFIQFGSFLWLLAASNLWMLYVFGVVFGFLWGGSSIVVTTFIGDIFGVRSLGTIMGMMNSGWSLGAAAGPVIGGVLYDISGHYVTAFAAGAVAVFVAAIFLGLIKRP